MKIFAPLAVILPITIPTGSRANTVAILTGGNTLVPVNTAAAAVTRKITIPISVGHLTVIDVRPADGQLCVYSADGSHRCLC